MRRDDAFNKHPDVLTTGSALTDQAHEHRLVGRNRLLRPVASHLQLRLGRFEFRRQHPPPLIAIGDKSLRVAWPEPKRIDRCSGASQDSRVVTC